MSLCFLFGPTDWAQLTQILFGIKKLWVAILRGPSVGQYLTYWLLPPGVSSLSPKSRNSIREREREREIIFRKHSKLLELVRVRIEKLSVEQKLKGVKSASGDLYDMRNSDEIP